MVSLSMGECRTMIDPILSYNDCWDIIRDLNEEAHSATYDMWEEADEIEDEDLAEEAREEASHQQAAEFREAFQTLDEETQKAILHYERTQPKSDMAQEFKAWWGDDE